MQGSNARNQYLTALVGWSSSAVLLLTSDETPLPSGKMSLEEASWIPSLLCVGSLFGNLFFGYIINKFGRKLPLIIITVPIVISGLLIIYAQNAYYLYVSRVLNGFAGGGGYSIVPLFLSEIGNDRVRGTLVSSLVLTENIGMLIAFVLGHFCDYYVMPKVMIALTVLFGVLLLFFPDTPTFLVKQNRIDEASKSIRFYHNLSDGEYGKKLVDIEIAKLKSDISDGEMQKSGEKSFEWSDLKNRIVQKAMIIGVVLVALNQFSGVVTMLNYTATIFQEAGSSISPNMSAIVIGAVQVFSTFISVLIVDRTGRKLLLAISNNGTAIGLIALGVFMVLKSGGHSVEAFGWVPLMSFSIVIFASALGILTVPIIVLTEVMPEKVKDFAVSILMSLLWIFSFITNKYLPFLSDQLGFGGSMFLFAGVCLACELFIIFFVPETKGKNHEKIMDSLR